MKKIIVPIDFSNYSEQALKSAANIARIKNAEIIALHMLELQEVSLSDSENYQKEKIVFYLKLAEKRFANFLNKDYLKGIKVTSIVKYHKVFKEVNEIADSMNADLIVMGSHGVNGAKEYFIGSNTEKMIRYANIPVLVIKNELADAYFEEVVFACDFSDEALNPYIKAKKTLASLGVNTHLLYVNLPNEKFNSTLEMEKKVASFMKRAGENIEEISKVNYVADYSIEKGVLNFSNLIGADLVAVITHGRRGMSHFFKGSISEDIANHSTLPVITFKI